MKVVILENTTRGLGDFNYFIRQETNYEVLVFTDTHEMLANCSKNHSYLFIIDMLTPGINENLIKKISDKHSGSLIIGLTNSSNDEEIRRNLSDYFSEIILKNPSMGNQVVSYLNKVKS